ncbi:MAG: hypothetical protein K2H52_17935 [Lachnospiraceae bacterium]|nr:hypothetical protein [Lachnospiraceae bacterium]MDE6185739.1 hypothetical protein [Lachnospiraceae bacterium]MDE7286875.1 hypothetical protein [Lachnospiraceae bacterium]
MKKFTKLFLTCGLLVFFAAGCADVAEYGSGKEAAAWCSAQALEGAAVTEEGYYVLEGNLHEIGRHAIVLETKGGELLSFQMAPETIVCSGENSEITAGQIVKVVFDGNLNGTEVEKISVIAVTVVEEEL